MDDSSQSWPCMRAMAERILPVAVAQREYFRASISGLSSNEEKKRCRWEFEVTPSDRVWLSDTKGPMHVKALKVSVAGAGEAARATVTAKGTPDVVRALVCAALGGIVLGGLVCNTMLQVADLGASMFAFFAVVFRIIFLFSDYAFFAFDGSELKDVKMSQALEDLIAMAESHGVSVFRVARAEIKSSVGTEKSSCGPTWCFEVTPSGLLLEDGQGLPVLVRSLEIVVSGKGLAARAAVRANRTTIVCGRPYNIICGCVGRSVSTISRSLVAGSLFAAGTWVAASLASPYRLAEFGKLAVCAGFLSGSVSCLIVDIVLNVGGREMRGVAMSQSLCELTAMAQALGILEGVTPEEIDACASWPQIPAPVKARTPPPSPPSGRRRSPHMSFMVPPPLRDIRC